MNSAMICTLNVVSPLQLLEAPVVEPTEAAIGSTITIRINRQGPETGVKTLSVVWIAFRN